MNRLNMLGALAIYLLTGCGTPSQNEKVEQHPEAIEQTLTKEDILKKKISSMPMFSEVNLENYTITDTFQMYDKPFSIATGHMPPATMIGIMSSDGFDTFLFYNGSESVFDEKNYQWKEQHSERFAYRLLQTTEDKKDSRKVIVEEMQNGKPTKTIRWVRSTDDNILEIGPAHYTIIDLGSGKTRAIYHNDAQEIPHYKIKNGEMSPVSMKLDMYHDAQWIVDTSQNSTESLMAGNCYFITSTQTLQDGEIVEEKGLVHKILEKINGMPGYFGVDIAEGTIDADRKLSVNATYWVDIDVSQCK